MTLHFKSAEGYHKYLAYKHMHVPGTKHKEKVEIAGKAHHVVHKKDSGFYGHMHPSDYGSKHSVVDHENKGAY